MSEGQKKVKTSKCVMNDKGEIYRCGYKVAMGKLRLGWKIACKEAWKEQGRKELP